MVTDTINIGISSCLLGNHVRYDGGHKLDRFIKGTLGRYVKFVPVCPEVECGLPVPRESMHLLGDATATRLLTTRTKIDHTERMRTWIGTRLNELAKEEFCGFIFKKGSPSCGMQRVKIYDEKGTLRGTGGGLFAQAFVERFPRIPVEEEGRLHDPELRERFIENVFALRRWRVSLEGGRRLARLMTFHSHEKLLLLAHSPNHYRLLGKLVGEGKGKDIERLYDEYERLFMEALRLKTTRVKNVNVLQHILGHFKKELSGSEKQEMLEIIGQYRKGYVPLIVPITLVNHYVRKYDKTHLAEQTYLNPHPVALQLRNNV